MSSIVTTILSTTVGLLWNKARDTTARKLKDGDVTDAKIREIVVRELNDIKSKIDGLSRTNLLSSYRFLKEGVDLLSASLDKTKDEQKDVLNEIQDRQDKPSTMTSRVESGILSKALELSDAMRKLKICSDKELEPAKKRFEEARKTATHAFCNEALSIKDRIFAAKLRVVSEILECLDNPETAITGCLSFLEDLHSLPGIRETFSVYLNGGMKSRLNKAERVENVKSVMLTNYVLFQFVLKFSSKYHSAYKWPTIELSDCLFRPILDWQMISTTTPCPWGEELITPPNELTLDETINPYYAAVNGQGDTVVMNGDDIKVISKTGEGKVIILPEPVAGELITQFVAAISVDSNNNVYVVRYLRIKIKEGRNVNTYVLYVLDENYNVKHEHTLDFLPASDLNFLGLAVNQNNNIILIKNYDTHVYVCDNAGNLKHKFERASDSLRGLNISDENEIIVASQDIKFVDVYTEEGRLKSLLTVPEDLRVCGAAFHSAICNAIVLTYNQKKRSYFLLCYSEAGELVDTSMFRCNVPLCNDKLFPSITSHPSGPAAVIRERSITFI